MLHLLTDKELAGYGDYLSRKTRQALGSEDFIFCWWHSLLVSVADEFSRRAKALASS